MLINCVISSSRPICYHRSFVLAPLSILISVVKLINKVAQKYLVIIINTTLLHPFIQCPSDQFRRVGGHPVVLVKVWTDGASVRRDYHISETEAAFGTLDVGEVREIVATRWLNPSHPEDVRVKRYQIKLLSRDDAGNQYTNTREMLGWINNRSCLKAEQYAIAKEIC